jgi:hypothetical protein
MDPGYLRKKPWITIAGRLSGRAPGGRCPSAALFDTELFLLTSLGTLS